MRTNSLIIGLTAVVLLSGCGSVRDTLVTGATTAGGAALGSHVTDGSPEGAALGGAVGLATGLGLGWLGKTDREENYRQGYEKAQSDSVKQLYWARKNAEKREGDYVRNYYVIETPEFSDNGVVREKSKRVIGIYEQQ